MSGDYQFERRTREGKKPETVFRFFMWIIADCAQSTTPFSFVICRAPFTHLHMKNKEEEEVEKKKKKTTSFPLGSTGK